MVYFQPPSSHIGKVLALVMPFCMCMSHNLQNALESGQETRIAHIDFSATFDRVEHQEIHFKLCYMGIGYFVPCVLIPFLSNRLQYVVGDGCLSNLVNVVSGVPHSEECFFPLLLILYISDLFFILENKLYDNVNKNKTKIMMVSRSRTMHSQSPPLTLGETVLEKSVQTLIFCV